MTKEHARKYLCLHCKRLPKLCDECLCCDEGEFFEEITAEMKSDDGFLFCSNCGAAVAHSFDMYCCCCGRMFDKVKADD